jgi:sterol desaturase/sphingolipid hydroxylase (fatty acid hydroxylase superfamily)
MRALLDSLPDFSGAALPWVFAFAFMTALELLLPRDRHGMKSRLVGLSYWAIWVPISVIVYGGYRALWHRFGLLPLIVLPLDFQWAGVLALVAAPVASAMLYDFFFYWFHRFQHRWLWRYHAVHHSIREMNAVNAYHHITEPFFQTLLLLLPASLIGGDTGYLAPVMVVVLQFQASFIHSPTSLHLGPLRWLIADNRFHRIHHSLEERHFDRNFGAFTTFWDRLFGTAHFPAADEWPDTGLADVPQPQSVGAWLALPFRVPRPAPETPATLAPPQPATQI